MSAVKYVGPHDAVEVDGLGVVKNGDTVEAGDLAASLLEQTDNWAAVKKSAAKTDTEGA